MKKNGKNPSGSQRWYCPDCRYSTTTKHDRQTKAKQFRQSLAYVTDTLPLRLHGQSLTTWDRDHTWCWSTRPIWQVTSEGPDPKESFASNIITPVVKPVKDTPDGPVEIDKTINTQQPREDSLHIRKGWTGR